MWIRLLRDMRPWNAGHLLYVPDPAAAQKNIDAGHAEPAESPWPKAPVVVVEEKPRNRYLTRGKKK